MVRYRVPRCSRDYPTAPLLLGYCGRDHAHRLEAPCRGVEEVTPRVGGARGANVDVDAARVAWDT